MRATPLPILIVLGFLLAPASRSDPLDGAGHTSLLESIRLASQEQPEFDWQSGANVESDIDNDGDLDYLLIGQSASQFLVAAVLASDSDSELSFLEFDISRLLQKAACGTPVGFRPTQRSEAPLNALGAYPPGYESCTTCMEYVLLDDGGCDPIVIYWNHADDKLDWWRA